MSSTKWLTRTIGRLVGVCALLCLAAPAVARAQGAPIDNKNAVPAVCEKIADQLGVKLAPSQLLELYVGATLNATLHDPAKLEKLGIKGMHEGARVTVMRSSADRLKVEVDEMDPTPVTKKATLKIDSEGRLSVLGG